jgi:transcription antitermination factor NusG
MAEPCLMSETLLQDSPAVTHAEAFRPDACWYAVQTLPRHEKKVSVELSAKAINCFLPTVSTLRQWSDRKRVIAQPLFAGYVFVCFDPDACNRIALLRTHGVVGLVGERGFGTPIPENEIRSIRQALESGSPLAPHAFVNVGQRVRVRGGSLDGLEGILEAVKADQSLIVSVELIQRSVSLTISGYVVEPVFEPKSA